MSSRSVVIAERARQNELCDTDWPALALAFDAGHCGLPTTVRDAGAWIMFAGTPYAYLHVCGTPWAGNEYTPGDEAIWTMRYQKQTAG